MRPQPPIRAGSVNADMRQDTAAILRMATAALLELIEAGTTTVAIDFDRLTATCDALESGGTPSGPLEIVLHPFERED